MDIVCGLVVNLLDIVWWWCFWRGICCWVVLGMVFVFWGWFCSSLFCLEGVCVVYWFRWVWGECWVCGWWCWLLVSSFWFCDRVLCNIFVDWMIDWEIMGVGVIWLGLVVFCWLYWVGDFLECWWCWVGLVWWWGLVRWCWLGVLWIFWSCFGWEVWFCGNFFLVLVLGWSLVLGVMDWVIDVLGCIWWSWMWLWWRCCLDCCWCWRYWCSRRIGCLGIVCCREFWILIVRFVLRVCLIVIGSSCWFICLLLGFRIDWDFFWLCWV